MQTPGTYTGFISATILLRWQNPVRWLAGRYMAYVSASTSVGLVPADIRPGHTYVLASNHQSRIDPFILTAALSGDAWQQLRPIRSFTHNGLLQSPFYNYFLTRLGCFPTKVHATLSGGLEFAIERLNAGENIIIFPEGRRTLPGESSARRGIQELAQQPGVEIIPVHLQWSKKLYYPRSLALAIGKPFDGSELTADEILARIYAVPLRG